MSCSKEFMSDSQTSSYKLSIIVCTKNRPNELSTCLNSIITQTVEPHEIIIVDGSTVANFVETLKTTLKLPRKWKRKITHIESQTHALTADRNTGVKNSEGDILFFFDDDVILDCNYLREVVKIFVEDKEEKVGGVMGNITNVLSKGFKDTVKEVFARVFLLPGRGNGRFRVSGAPTFIEHKSEVCPVEFLSGCCMAYRRKVFGLEPAAIQPVILDLTKKISGC